MKLQVPFYKQTKKFNCGPTALRMVLSFLEKDYGLKILEAGVGQQKGRSTPTIRLAITASKLGFLAQFYSASLYFNENNLDLEYYRLYSDFSLESSKTLIREAKKNKVGLYEKSISLNKLLSYVTGHSLPIVLLDWNVVTSHQEKGYLGHFVPIVGYDNKFIYVHNQGPSKPKKYYAIKKEIFEKARKAKGTDEDIVIISKKS